MNSKGEFQLGSLILAFVGVIVGLTLLTGAITSNIGASVNTQDFNNDTQIFPTTGATLDLNGKAVVGTIVITNASSGAVIDSTNYTVLNNQLNTAGELTAQLQGNGGIISGQSANLSYTTQPVGFIPDAGGRTIASLIIVFMCLAIAVVALVPALRSGVVDMFS